MEGYIVRILHISDLHFGIKTGKNVTKEKIAERNYFMDDLVKGLGSITESQPLDYIFITGDIACTAPHLEQNVEWCSSFAPSDCNTFSTSPLPLHGLLHGVSAC